MEMRQIGNGFGSLLLSFGLVALLALPAAASPPPPPRAPAPPAPEGPRLEMMLEAVDATDAQRARIEAIQADFEDRMNALHERMGDLYEQMEGFRDAGAPVDIAALRPVAEALGDLTAEGIILGAQMRSDIAMVLTEEQRAKLARMRDLEPRAPRADRRHRDH